METDAKYRSAVSAQYFLLGIAVLQIVFTFTLSAFNGFDRIAMGALWLTLVVVSCYNLFTVRGRTKMREQADQGFPKTGKAKALYWGVFVVFIFVVFALILLAGMPFWAGAVAAVPGAFVLSYAIKYVYKLDAKWLGEKSSLHTPPSGEHPWGQS